MPLHDRYTIAKGTCLWVWRLTEREDTLRQGIEMYPALVQRLSCFKSEQHRRETLAVQHLLIHAGISPSEVTHDAHGIPRLPKGHISISHTRDYVAIAIGPRPLGVDVEREREQVHRVAEKFIHPSENFAKTTEERIQLWTAKEAVYKALEWPGLQLNSELVVAPFEKASARAQRLNQLKELQLYFFHLPQHKLTVALLK